MAILPIVHKLLIWCALADLLKRLDREINSTQTLIAFDRPNEDLAQQIALNSRNNTYTLMLNLQAPFDMPPWQSLLNTTSHTRSMSILIFSWPSSFFQLQHSFDRIFLRPTVLIINKYNQKRTYFLDLHKHNFSGRLLFVLASPTSFSYKMFAWSLQRNQFVSIKSLTTLFDKQNRSVQLFWDTVNRLPLPPLFRIDFLPPYHINTCSSADAPKQCYLFGPDIFLANLIASKYRRNHRPILQSQFDDGFEDKYRRLFESYRLTYGDAAIANSRSLVDGFASYRHSERTAQVERNVSKHLVFSLLHRHGLAIGVRCNALRLIVPRVRNKNRQPRRRILLAGAGSIVIVLTVSMLYVDQRLTMIGSRQRRSVPRRKPDDLLTLIIDTLVLTLGSANAGKVSSGASTTHRCLFVVLCAYGQMISSIVSCLFLQRILFDREATQIDTMADLVQTRLARVAPLELYDRRHTTMPILPMQMQLTTLWDMEQMLWSRNTSTAFVITENYLGLLRTARLHYANGEPVYHMARDPAGRI